MGWPKGKSRKSDSAVVPAVAVGKDSFEKKLDHFQYDESAVSQVWEAENPLDVPRDVKKANPGMQFRWRAKDAKEGLRRGNTYDGWQVYRDNEHPSGIEVGGDLVLCAMPRERAESRNRRYQEESSANIRAKQEEAMNINDELDHLQRAGDFRVTDATINIGASKSRNKTTGEVRTQYRGYHPEELKEIIAKNKEQNARGRKFFT